MTKPFFVFDLDDTLYLERDYSVSALVYLGGLLESELSVQNAADDLLVRFENGEPDTIGSYWNKHKLNIAVKDQFIDRMRSHHPTIELFPDTEKFLDDLRKRDIKFAIVTDGRSVTQRAKIAALGLNDAAAIAISGETGASKPASEAFAPVLEMIEDHRVIFVGDNPVKDFIYPNEAGWDTYMRKDNGMHVHKQHAGCDESDAGQVIANFAALNSCL